MDEIILRLIDIKEDIDAIHHHQTDRIVNEIDEVIKRLRDMKGAESKSA